MQLLCCQLYRDAFFQALKCTLTIGQPNVSGHQVVVHAHNFVDPRTGVHTQEILFLTSELANKAEIYILSARDTTRARVPGRGIMGINVRVSKTRYNTWLSSRLQNQLCSLARLIFLRLVLSFLGTMHSVW